MNSLLFLDDNMCSQGSVVNSVMLINDLNLKHIFNVCSNGDSYVLKAVKDTMLRAGMLDTNTILYRQDIMRDLIVNHVQVNELYILISMALKDYDEAYIKNTPSLSRNAPVSSRMRNSLALYESLLSCIVVIKQKLKDTENIFKSKNVLDYIKSFTDFYSDEFLSDAFKQLKKLGHMTSNESITLSAGLGYGLKAGDIVIQNTNTIDKEYRKARRKSDELVLSGIAIQTQANSIREGALLKPQRIINDITRTTYDHLKQLNYSLAFYLGCTNLYHTLKGLNIPVAYPCPKE